MKQFVWGFITITAVTVLCGGCIYKFSNAKKAEEQLEISKKMFQEFSMTLKGELQKAISEKGPAGAIEVCKKVSKETEEKFSAKYPDLISVRRISLKTRNPERHTPTDDEKYFLVREGKNWNTPNRGQSTQMITTIGKYSKVYFQISVGDPLCLLCHGAPEQILPEIKDALKEHYPKDQATGYQMGDFRGAFVVKWEH